MCWLWGACSKQPDSQQSNTAAVAEAPGEQAQKENVEQADNPFFQVYDTPFQIPPFNEIKGEHYMPAFEQDMKEHLAEIDAIVQNPEAPTFANTVEELERTAKVNTL